jgi:hypothetical protein
MVTSGALRRHAIGSVTAGAKKRNRTDSASAVPIWAAVPRSSVTAMRPSTAKGFSLGAMEDRRDRLATRQSPSRHGTSPHPTARFHDKRSSGGRRGISFVRPRTADSWPATLEVVALPTRKVFVMALNRLARMAAPAGLTAAVLSVAALVLFITVVGSGTISEAAVSPAFYAPTLASLGSIIALLVALVALFVRESGELGMGGLTAFLAALVGTVLGAGGYWSYVFVVPYLAENAPGLADQSSGAVLVGFVVSYLLMGLGWLAFAVATLRTRIFPRWAVVFLMVGSVVTIVPMPSRTLLLSVAVGCLGYFVTRPVAATASEMP